MKMRRLLVLETRMLGDAILCLPFLRGAAASFDVQVLCLPPSRPIFENVLPPEKVIVCDVPWMSRRSRIETVPELLRVRSELAARKFDAAVTVWPDVRLHGLMIAIGAVRRVGFGMTNQNFFGSHLPWRQRQLRIGQALTRTAELLLRRPLLTDTVSKKDINQRRLSDWQMLGEVLEITPRMETPWLPANPAALGPEFVRFVEQERAAGRPVWMVHPGASAANRRWPLERFQSLLDDYFPARGVSVVVLRPPDSPPLSVRRDHQLDYSARNLKELAAATAAVDGILCNDSMMMHLAAALGRTVVSIFGAGGRGWFAPLGSEELMAFVDVCPYQPCLDHCLMPSPSCIEQLGIDVVKAKLDLALGQPETPS